jgi:hypothetical protein
VPRLVLPKIWRNVRGAQSHGGLGRETGSFSVIVGVAFTWGRACGVSTDTAHPSTTVDLAFARSPLSNVTSVSCPTVANAAR